MTPKLMKTTKIQVTVQTDTAVGDIPGHYQDVQVAIGRKPNGRWMVDIVETWGIDQGFDEEQCRKQVIGRDATLDGAVARARRLAESAGIEPANLMPSLEQAIAQAKSKQDGRRN